MKTMVQDVGILSAAAVTGENRVEFESALSRLKEIFPPKALRRLPAYARAGLLAVHLAADKTDTSLGERESIGLVAATSTGCKETGFNFMDSILDEGPQLSSPLAFSHSVINMAAGLVCQYMKFAGPSLTVIEDSLSFAAAVQAAQTMLRLGKAQTMCVLSVEENDERHTRLCGVTEPMVGAVAIFLARGGASRVSVSFGSGSQCRNWQKAHKSQLSHAGDFCGRVQAGETTCSSTVVSALYGRWAEIHVGEA